MTRPTAKPRALTCGWVMPGYIGQACGEPATHVYRGALGPVHLCPYHAQRHTQEYPGYVVDPLEGRTP